MEGGLQALVPRETISEIRRDRQLCKHLFVVVVVVVELSVSSLAEHDTTQRNQVYSLV